MVDDEQECAYAYAWLRECDNIGYENGIEREHEERREILEVREMCVCVYACMCEKKKVK